MYVVTLSVFHNLAIWLLYVNKPEPYRSAVYKRKRIGPRTEPCGAPHSNVEGVELRPLNRTYCTRCSRI